MSTLVIAEHNNQTLSAATLKTVSAAHQLGTNVDILIAGYECNSVVETARQIENVNKVLVCDSSCLAHQLAENITPIILALADDYSHIIASATTTGKNLMPRVAALLDVTQISDITAIESPEIFYRPIYAGNAVAKVKSLDNKKIITVRTTAFEPAELTGNATVSKLAEPNASPNISHVEDQLSVSKRPELTAAPVVISGGRGMQNGKNFSLLEAIADKLGGAVGASRAAVDAGFVPNDLQVGQTGKIVAPNLYIAVGLSGAIQHLAGMKESKVIVAINKDPDAPIFQVADYGLVADLFDVLPELTSKL
ncbi:MAG: electron transfer flavoprotein subunit alpha/FixB family protein [Thalassotalea sp.]